MPKKRRTRVFWRRGRAYFDGRDFADVGGGKEALVAPGESYATEDPDVATKLAADRLEELEQARRGRTLLGVERVVSLKGYASHHLAEKKRAGEAVRRWLKQSQRHLQAAVDFFGPATELPTITPDDLSRYVNHLRQRSNGRGGTLSDTSVRKYLNSLSNMFARALSERYVRSNPVADMYVKPTESSPEADYLSAAEAALLLEAARLYRPAVEAREQEHGGSIRAEPNPWVHPILATFLLTGGRKSEVLGLEVDDVSFRLGKVYFRSNDWRRLKTKRSKRSVPLWPQLEEILRAYMAEREASGGLGRLLFPSVGGRPRREGGKAPEAGERMITDLRRALDTVGERAGFPKGHVRLHMLRHTYTAARIQTLDRGAPVALFTVARELGHSSTDMIEDRYGHLHDRAVLGGKEVVEHRVEDHRDELADRLEALAPRT